MRLDLEQIASIAQGAARVWQEEDGIHFCRFTEEQQAVYAGTPRYGKTLAPAGVVLAFRTDSERLRLGVAVSECINRRAFAHDILKNGRLIGQVANLDQEPLVRCPGAGGTPWGPGPSLGEFAGSFELGEGEKEIRIVFPWSVLSVLRCLELEDGASLVPVKPKRKIVFYGDSITQGYDARYPSMHHTVRIAQMLGAEGFNKAIGGDRFHPALAACPDPFEPEDILVAYGTNDWSHEPLDVFQQNCLEFYRLLSENYPNARIWALTPLWRADHQQEKSMGPISRVEEQIRDVAERFPNITVVRGWDLVPHESGFYNDRRLHPNDFGFFKYFGRLQRKMVKAGLAGELAARGSCGEQMFWEMDPASKTLHITGRGMMDDWSDEDEDAPWYPYSGQIESLIVDEGVRSLGDRAFHRLTALRSVTLPEGLEVIGVNAFQGCTALAEIAVPEGVRLLASKAFNECTGLEKVRLPKSLRCIDMKGFSKDAALRQVVYGGSERQWEQMQISRQAKGNDPLVHAERICQKEDAEAKEEEGSAGPAAGGGSGSRQTDRYDLLTARAREVISSGGDGKLYIFDPMKFEDPDKNVTKCGDCTVILFPRGTTMMIDGGNAHCADQTLRFIERIGLKRVDYLVMSHSHSDHVNGAVKIAQYLYENGGSIGRYYGTRYAVGEEPALRDVLREHGTQIIGDVKVPCDFPEIDGVSIEILNPTEEVLAACEEMMADGEKHHDGPVNNVSILMRFSFGRSSYLTGGDLYRDRERTLAAELGEKLHADVMKTNHHGTHTSSCKEWLDAVHPRIAISESDDNGSQLLVEECGRRGIAYYAEGVDGLIMAVMDRDGSCQVETQYGSSVFYP